MCERVQGRAQGLTGPATHKKRRTATHKKRRTAAARVTAAMIRRAVGVLHVQVWGGGGMAERVRLVGRCMGSGAVFVG
jgi:hypothetical protein